ncbi:hypothetical protein [Ensifer adhaerens]|uniref:hypothetical protein n=1 Tax=Ensifer adhaerens TaxID=106592 RepID=UPI00128EF784|nr:hypothetical protein [Ensifer adhaerens]
MDATVPSATAISFFIRSSQNLARTIKPENVIDFNGDFQRFLVVFSISAVNLRKTGFGRTDRPDYWGKLALSLSLVPTWSDVPLAIGATHAKAGASESSIRIRTRPKQDCDDEMTKRDERLCKSRLQLGGCCWNGNTSLLADRLAEICPHPIV